MTRLRLGLSTLGLAAIAVGCGGRVIDDSGSDGSETSNPAPSSTTAGNTASGGKSGKSNSSSGTLPSTMLGECTPGFVRDRNPERPCRWVTESGMCFDTTEAACACICPTNRESVCAHGFDGGPNAAKLVRCD